MVVVQIIVVPIFWNKKADEKETVIAAAEQVLQQLQQLGVQAGLDDTNADTPGQKYRYWYHTFSPQLTRPASREVNNLHYRYWACCLSDRSSCAVH